MRLQPFEIVADLAPLKNSALGRLTTGALWSAVGGLGSQGLAVLASIAAARILGQGSFGALSVIQSTVGMFGTFSGMGAGLTATKYVAELRGPYPKRAGSIISLSYATATCAGSILALLLYVVADQLAASTLGAPELSEELRTSAGLVLFSAIHGTQVGVLSGLESFRVLAHLAATRGALILALSTAGAIAFDLRGAIWGLVLSNLLTCMIGAAVISRLCQQARIPRCPSAALCELRVLLDFSLPSLLSNVLVAPVTWIVHAILVNQAGGFGQMAIVAAATQWRLAIGFLPSTFGQALLPVLSNLHGGRQYASYRAALVTGLGVTSATALAVAVPTVLGAQTIMGSYGHRFQAGAPVLMLFAAAAVLAAVNSVAGHVIASAGVVWTGFAFNTLWACLFLASAIVLIPKWLGLGLALAQLVAYAGHTVWQAVFLHHILGKLKRAASKAQTTKPVQAITE